MSIPFIKPSISALKEINLFRSFSDSELTQIIGLGEGQNYEAHSNIIIEGELTWGLYILFDGIVGISKTNKLTGNNFELGILRRGNFFGEMSLIDDNPRSATVRSLTPCQLFYLSKASFLSFLDQSQDLKIRFYSNCVRTLVGRLRELDDNYVISQYQLWETALRKGADSK